MKIEVSFVRVWELSNVWWYKVEKKSLNSTGTNRSYCSIDNGSGGVRGAWRGARRSATQSGRPPLSPLSVMCAYFQVKALRRSVRYIRSDTLPTPFRCGRTKYAIAPSAIANSVPEIGTLYHHNTRRQSYDAMRNTQ